MEAAPGELVRPRLETVQVTDSEGNVAEIKVQQTRRDSWNGTYTDVPTKISNDPFRNQSPLSGSFGPRSRSTSPIHYSYYATKESDSPTLNRSFRRYVVDFPPPSPGAEWIVGSRRSRVMDAWDVEGISKNCFPAAIFGIHNQKNPLKDGEESLPSAAELSDKSSSTWSSKEESLEKGCKHCCSCSKQECSLPVQEDQPPMVEISPGVSAPLRGSEETVRAVRLDFYTPITCFGCSQDMFCIADAKYAICPACKVVSPNEESYFEGKALQQHGLGLGFTCESLFEMQAKILLEN